MFAPEEPDTVLSKTSSNVPTHAGIQDVPEEVVLEVLGYLNPGDLLRAGLTCR